MDVEPHRSVRGGIKGTFIEVEGYTLPGMRGSLEAQPLTIKATVAYKKIPYSLIATFNVLSG